MRKITQKAQKAFNNNETFSLDNTTVAVCGNKTSLYLHGNLIAWKYNEETTYFSLCGWNTPTTRERLQAANISVVQRKGEPYYINNEREELWILHSGTYEVTNDKLTAAVGV